MTSILYATIFHLFEENDTNGKYQLSSEVMQWFDDNNIEVEEVRFRVPSSSSQYGLKFLNDVDHMAFKLRWL